ncbi:hypothetical protein D0469_12010 [Peribacillus saganii]|uniref:Spore coat protein n=1 Tax=Peribacillus saganii TaxID=2303992 RepID=A0A372LPE0_9BACI|nr:YppG family protein [Peribacillus saganii]RFU68456.1 hypothetical protein D0469_12010 [Peribacillus saganii]
MYRMGSLFGHQQFTRQDAAIQPYGGMAQQMHYPQHYGFPAGQFGGYQAFEPAQYLHPHQRPPFNGGTAGAGTYMQGTQQSPPQAVPYYTEKQNNPFDNPLQPSTVPHQQPGIHQFVNPYPKQSFMQKPQQAGISSVLNQFKTQDGSIDINKMMNTAGQVLNTVSQVSAMFKGAGSLFKS